MLIKTILKILKFNDYKNCLFKNEIILKSQRRSKSEAYNIYTEEFSKIILSIIMVKDYKLLIELEHIHMEEMLLK